MHRAATSTRAARAGLAVTAVLLVLTFTVPALSGWDTGSRPPAPGRPPVPPLRGYLDVTVFGPGTVPALLLAVLGVVVLPRLAERIGWRALLLLAYAVGVAWMLSLAYVDGSSGVSRVQALPEEYLASALEVADVGETLAGFTPRIAGDHPDVWPAHVAGHPPGALLFFVALTRLGLDTPFSSGLAVVAVAALATPGVLVTLRALGAEDLARRAAPFLVLAPSAVFMAVSADAVFSTVTAWGLASLSLAATASGRRMLGWSMAAGVLLGAAVMMSYGLPLIGLVALGILVVARSWTPLPVAAVSALAVVLAFVPFGFSWWEAYPLLHDRYWEGIAADRPQAYWFFGDLGALLVSAGPVAGVGVACALSRVRQRVATPEWTAAVLATAAAGAVVLADLSRMSKAEVERIWLPFMPWLLVAAALVPPRWRPWALGAQVVVALAVQHLVWTEW